MIKVTINIDLKILTATEINKKINNFKEILRNLKFLFANLRLPIYLEVEKRIIDSEKCVNMKNFQLVLLKALEVKAILCLIYKINIYNDYLKNIRKFIWQKYGNKPTEEVFDFYYGNVEYNKIEHHSLFNCRVNDNLLKIDERRFDQSVRIIFIYKIRTVVYNRIFESLFLCPNMFNYKNLHCAINLRTTKFTFLYKKFFMLILLLTDNFFIQGYPAKFFVCKKQMFVAIKEILELGVVIDFLLCLYSFIRSPDLSCSFKKEYDNFFEIRGPLQQ